MSLSSEGCVEVFPGKLPVPITANCQYMLYKAMLQVTLERTKINREKELTRRKVDKV